MLSVKMQEPQFSGQTKERLSSRECAAFVSGVVKDSLSLWLNQHTEAGQAIADLAIDSAQRRLRAGRRVARKKVTSGPALPGKLADCSAQDLDRTEPVPRGGRLCRAAPPSRGRSKDHQAVMPSAGQDPQHLGRWIRPKCWLPRKCTTSRWPSAWSRARATSPGCVTGKSAFSPMPTPTARTSLLCCARFSCATSGLWSTWGRVYVAMPPLYRIDVGKRVFYALDDDEKQGLPG